MPNLKLVSSTACLQEVTVIEGPLSVEARVYCSNHFAFCHQTPLWSMLIMLLVGFDILMSITSLALTAEELWVCEGVWWLNEYES